MPPYFIAERISLSELRPCLVTSTRDATLRKLGIIPEAQASLHCEKKKNSKTMITSLFVIVKIIQPSLIPDNVIKMPVS